MPRLSTFHRRTLIVWTLLASLAWLAAPAAAQQPPNIVFIMGDDIGWFNIGAYHQGLMAGKTPHLDQLAAEGMRFTDYYAEASCTAGLANFITGELPIRTGLTTVGQAGAALGIPAPDTINGITQLPIEGVSMAHTWDKANADAPSQHTTQYFEMLGNRAIYHEGWVACTTPATLPWELSTATPPDVISGYTWELYNVDQDPTQSNDLAGKMPEKLKACPCSSTQATR